MVGGEEGVGDSSSGVAEGHTDRNGKDPLPHAVKY